MFIKVSEFYKTENLKEVKDTVSPCTENGICIS